VRSAGCSFNCGWCGGSRDAFRRIFGTSRTSAPKSKAASAFEWSTLQQNPQCSSTHFYSVGTYNLSKTELLGFVESVSDLGVRSVSYEQFHLPSDDVMRAMASANSRSSITLSPESHDREIATRCGRGVYDNAELERWIERAFDCGIHQIDFWYFCGMPGQTVASVMQTVAYGRHLLEKFAGRRLNPMICPMVPFLDPASTFFESPDRHGYRRFCRTLAEHEDAMTRASIIHRMNYETTAMSRDEIVLTGFEAIRQMMEAKAEFGSVPRTFADPYIERICDSIEFTRLVHDADSIPDPVDRARALADLGPEIRQRNEALLYGGVRNQAFPIARAIGGRWFDEYGWSFAELDASV